MGMLGGLALGGMLGAMFFGGAFEGFNFMDILIFGGIAYLLYKLFLGKAGARQRPAYSSNNYRASEQNDYSSGYSKTQQSPFSTSTKQSSTGFDTDYLFNKDKSQNSTSNVAGSYNDVDAGFNEESENIVPEGFDEVDFLAGAKGAFKDLQKAWDKHELAEIRGLTTDKVFAEIQDQLKNSNELSQTDILKVDAELLSIREIDSELEAVVLFDTIIREEADEQAEQVREVWHFIKSKNSLQSKWYLDGIQQLEQ